MGGSLRKARRPSSKRIPTSFAPISGKERSVLELRDVVCCYGPVAALKGVSLTVGQGQLVALIGANGAGKTTTLRAISGLLHPAAGTIVFEAHYITKATPRAILTPAL